MRLVAIYIKQHDYLFDKPQMINLGGKYFYECIPNEMGKLGIKRVENKNFIENFWGDNISLVSAIVGENGVGKTSILKELVMSFDRFRQGTSFDNIAFVYEINNTFIVDTKLEFISEKTKEDFSKVRIEYYNPVLDYDLQDISGYINPSNIFKNTLEEYHLNILKYQVLFNYSPVSESLKKIYENDFPKFGSVLLRAKLHYKHDFEKIFALSNLQEGMRKYLEKVFNKYPNSDQKNNQFLHNQNNFFENIEVTILSILVINNLYNVGSGSGISKYSIDEMLVGDDFLVILEKFKKQYILLNSTEEVLKEYEEKNFFEFREYLHRQATFFIYPNHRKNILRILRMFNAFEDFYKKILKLSEEEGFSEYSNNLFFSNHTNNQKTTDNMVIFISIYSRLLAQLNMLHVKNPSLIEFSFFDTSSHNRLILSNGEKALLNLYSIIYNFALNSQIKSHEWKNFIFLLDEADLGFHPEWKKRFINSIVKVFPEILKDISTLESIQIIFTTHDPLTLSDIPNSNVVYLKKKGVKTDVLTTEERPQRSFGANITDLLSDSFFINDGLIGDFAKEKIQITLEWLKKEANKKQNAFVVDKKFKLPIFNSREREIEYHKLIIELIDEPLVKNKLKSMYLEFVSDDEYFKNDEIERLKAEIKKLESK